MADAHLEFVLAAKERVFSIKVHIEGVLCRMEVFFDGDELRAAVGFNVVTAADAVVVVGLAEAVAIGGAEFPIVIKIVFQSGKDFAATPLAV